MLLRFPRMYVRGSRVMDQQVPLSNSNIKFRRSKEIIRSGLTRMNAGSKRNQSKYNHSLKFISLFSDPRSSAQIAAKIRCGLKPPSELEYASELP
jgi:hypothetical protein